MQNTFGWYVYHCIQMLTSIGKFQRSDLEFHEKWIQSKYFMLYHINIFGHSEIPLFPPSQLVSVAEIQLRHFRKYHSKQAKLISNVLKGLIVVSYINFTYFSNISLHFDTYKDISNIFSRVIGFMPKIHPILATYRQREPLFTLVLIDFSYDIQVSPIGT